jgi:hypothetical protein
MAMFDEPFARHLALDIYSDRLAQVQPTGLVRLETATIYPTCDYVVSVGSVVIEEQTPPRAAGGSKLQAKDKATVTVDTPKRSEEVLQETVISRSLLGIPQKHPRLDTERLCDASDVVD